MKFLKTFFGLDKEQTQPKETKTINIHKMLSKHY